jgi:mRNA-degrading endonuclease YafQ of YafQ-DinJ toxin-antitoxin module
MLKIRYSSRFKKDFKAIIKRGYDDSPAGMPLLKAGSSL